MLWCVGEDVGQPVLPAIGVEQVVLAEQPCLQLLAGRPTFLPERLGFVIVLPQPFLGGFDVGGVGLSKTAQFGFHVLALADECRLLVCSYRRVDISQKVAACFGFRHPFFVGGGGAVACGDGLVSVVYNLLPQG